MGNQFHEKDFVLRFIELIKYKNNRNILLWIKGFEMIDINKNFVKTFYHKI